MNISLRDIYSINDEQAHQILRSRRWNDNDGNPVCPKCGCPDYYDLATRQVYKCKGCHHQYSVTSGTWFSGRKISPSEIIGIVFLFATAKKGISSCQLSRTVSIDQKSAYYINEKIRKAIMLEVQSQKLDGIVEIDGATFGGHRRHANMAQDFSGAFKRYTIKKTKNRRVITIMKQRGGRTVPFIGFKESDALEAITKTVSSGAIIQADEARAWDGLLRLYDMMRIKHSYAFSSNQACTNNAESFFAQMRKAHSGTFQQISGDKWDQYACEIAWKRDHTKLSAIEQTAKILDLCLQQKEAA